MFLGNLFTLCIYWTFDEYFSLTSLSNTLAMFAYFCLSHLPTNIEIGVVCTFFLPILKMDWFTQNKHIIYFIQVLQINSTSLFGFLFKAQNCLFDVFVQLFLLAERTRDFHNFLRFINTHNHHSEFFSD